MADLLELVEISISNFLSIKDKITIPIKKYNNSSTTILVGKNDCGKSNLLNALSYLNYENKPIVYKQLCHRDYKNESKKYIDLYFKFAIQNQSAIRRDITSLNIFPAEFVDLIDIQIITKNVFASAALSNFSCLYNIIISKKAEFSNYMAVLVEDNATTKTKIITTIMKKDSPNITEEYKEITITNIQETLNKHLKPILNQKTPKVVNWSSDDRYLIFNSNPNLQLSSFVTNPDSLVPLKNMFLISGFNDESMKLAINNALADADSRRDLESDLSEKTTTYIQNVWGNQNIKISVNIEEGGKCTIHVEDTKNRYFDMQNKSDGFKQFISLILSLSAENSAKKLSNTLVLIDEPETHLYPESILFMKDELLKIGENNVVFIATHSPFMIDRNVPERHWKVEKNGIDTSIIQINDSISMWDNKVLESAFGLNVFKELLPQNIIIVEGNDDKIILEHILKLLQYKKSYAIKSAGGCPHVYALSSMFYGEKIYPYFVLDDDADGRKAKNDVTVKRKEYRNRTFTIKDLTSLTFDRATLEDLYPTETVKTFFDTKQNKIFTFNSTSPIIAQIINQDETLKGNDDVKKNKRNQLKEELALKIKGELSKTNLATKAPLLRELGEKIIEKLDATPET